VDASQALTGIFIIRILESQFFRLVFEFAEEGSPLNEIAPI
jgi:hypothetical protein